MGANVFAECFVIATPQYKTKELALTSSALRRRLSFASRLLRGPVETVSEQLPTSEDVQPMAMEAIAAEGQVGDIAQDHWDEMFAAPKAATWHSNPLVAAEIGRRLGTDTHWLFWVFQQKLRVRPRRLLSIGCGDGSHELILSRNGLAEYVEAFDLSGVGISKAQEAVAEENLNAQFYQSSFDEFVSRPHDVPFDAVMFVGSLHHVRDLEGMLSKVRRILTEDGVLIYNEYVGPCYIILPDEQVAIVNNVIAAIPPEYKHSPEVHWINPTIEVVLDGDPSESVRSALIRPFLRMYFDVAWETGFGGALLHPLFQMLHGDKLADDSPGSRAVVGLCIEIENALMRAGLLQDDFCIGVAHPRRASGD